MLLKESLVWLMLAQGSLSLFIKMDPPCSSYDCCLQHKFEKHEDQEQEFEYETCVSNCEGFKSETLCCLKVRIAALNLTHYLHVPRRKSIPLREIVPEIIPACVVKTNKTTAPSNVGSKFEASNHYVLCGALRLGLLSVPSLAIARFIYSSLLARIGR